MKYPQLVSMPSAVSDWLEEQLEARGIDSVVYTRYILSLLHRDSADFICSEQDSRFAYSEKEVRRSGSRKRLRRSNEGYGFDSTDLDQLKRAAAVECLMSASDQKCGIESLVDELCQKLKDIKSESIENIPPPNKISQNHQDPAKEYYAAFPALSGNKQSPAILVPKWLGSPKKRSIRKCLSYDEKFHAKIEHPENNMKARSVGKQRLGRGKRDFGFCRNMAKSVEKGDGVNRWDLYLFTDVARSKWGGKSGGGGTNDVAPLSKETEQSLDADTWNTDDSMNLYNEDLLDDIRELLNSPEPRRGSVEMMNLANVRETSGNKFIPCGTNITSSIWSNHVNEEKERFNAGVVSDLLGMGLQFSSISIENDWPEVQNESNAFLESFGGRAGESMSVEENIWNSARALDFEKLEKWSEPDQLHAELHLNIMARSLLKLNHNKEFSSFTEVIPRSLTSSYTPPSDRSVTVRLPSREQSENKEDLLTSDDSHFRPINEKTSKPKTAHYEDGTTFVIPNNLDKITYKRSKSGLLCLETEYGTLKKYLEYKGADCLLGKSEFVLKFNVCQNDKACQTDFEEVDAELEPIERKKGTCDATEDDEFYFPGDEDVLNGSDNCQCKGNTDESFFEDCPVHSYRPSSLLAEFMWKCETERCDKCNVSGDSWNFEQGSGKGKSLFGIWGGDVCKACLGMNKSSKATSNKNQNTQLREDISHDGEQLLSDLSNIQQSYMEELPATELTCDLIQLLGNKDRKRRHSFVTGLYGETVSAHQGSWSFASRLKQDCLIQMSTIPTLRSVTL